MVLAVPDQPKGSAETDGRPNQRRPRKQSWIKYVAKPAVFVVCLLPLAWLIFAAFAGGLGANPIEAINRFLGDWALRFLLIALAVSPVAGVTGWKTVMQFRRMLGLFAFFYVTIHVLAYVGLDHFFAWGAIWDDIVKRTFITVGMLSFLLLLPLAVTSTKGWIKRLGAVRWQRLHRLVYPAAILATLHFAMMVKADLREPLIYATILAALLGWRVWARARRVTARDTRSMAAAAGP